MIRMVQVVFADRVPTNSIPRVQSPNLSASRMNRGYLLISGYGYAYPGKHFVGQHWDFSEPLQQVPSLVASDTSRSYSAILQRNEIPLRAPEIRAASASRKFGVTKLNRKIS